LVRCDLGGTIIIVVIAIKDVSRVIGESVSARRT
jgi:hypothetical protein